MATKPLFLIVDDDADDRDLLNLAYQEGSYQCDLVFAEDGREALKLLEQSPVRPSVMLVDINMPGMNGLELLQKLKSSARWKGMPVVMLTTSNNPRLIHDAYSMGANSYLVKPDNYHTLSSLWDALYGFWTNTAKLPTYAVSQGVS
ncbi:response regulator [Siphonobacter curvatus]|uniref:Response regulator n=1 Tax=Siphonobacter curvatus TaxID=2094562 RepID=A0A2S7IPU1_9BACT|nr:response regulator [Siphonobacter curvatus]PQA59648.1 response regulator [Siphonobacter curvatus]